MSSISASSNSVIRDDNIFYNFFNHFSKMKNTSQDHNDQRAQNAPVAQSTSATSATPASAPVKERTRCEVWTRVMGYHRSVSHFNTGKKSEHCSRQHFEEMTSVNSDFCEKY